MPIDNSNIMVRFLSLPKINRHQELMRGDITKLTYPMTSPDFADGILNRD